ncbi:MAG: N-methyl-L-tryptophan oxidase [Planctomycetes bacterium]|nr:N-methyl-L-tryptophan oxidase [Planctomycetota bacterium]
MSSSSSSGGSYDVIVAGVGAVGSATCYHLAKRGLRVLGLERFAIPHAQGGSHGFSRQTKIAPYIGSPYEPIILRAYELWRELVAESGQKEIMVTTGFLDLHPDRTFPGYHQNAGHFEDLGLAQLRQRFPQFQLSEPYWGAYDPVGALLRPEMAITTYVRLAMQHGAQLSGNTELLEWKTDQGGVTVNKDRDTYTADRIVFCAGPWTGKLLKALGIACTATRMSFGWVWPLRNMEAYLPESMPCWCITDEDGIYYGFPMMTDVPGYKIGLHWYGQPVDPDAFDRKPNARDEELIRKGLRKYFPDGNGPLLGLRTCMYDHTVDDVPIIDNHPELKRVTLCGPLCGAGFKFVPAYAEAAADLATQGKSDLKIDFLRIDRLLK